MTTRKITFSITILIIGGVWGLSAPVCLYAASLDPTEISALFHEANELFQQADKLAETHPEEANSLYQKSVMRLERIVNEGGIENGKLYYNIGNMYFRMKDIGRAILNYRRAEQYIPNDTNLQQNLAFARSVRTDQIEEKQETKILKVLFFWHYDFSVNIRWVLFCISFAMVWVCASVNLFLRKSILKWSLIGLMMLSVLFAGSLIVEHIHLQKTVPGVVISSEVIARKGNSESYDKSFKDPLHAGTEFTVIEKRGNWFQTRLGRLCEKS